MRLQLGNNSLSRASLKVDQETAKAIRGHALALLVEIADYFTRENLALNEIIFVPTTIMSRIIRTQDAIDLLLREGFLVEAAVLALTQFELRMDLLYVASDIKRATQWVNHENVRATPTNMKDKLRSLFKRANADRLYKTYGYLSGIKHGNPLYSDLGFPGRRRRGGFVIATGAIDDKFARAFSDALSAYSAYQLIFSAQVINKLVAQYAVIDKETRRTVHDQYLLMKDTESAFRSFLGRKLSARKTFFGVKGMVRATGSASRKKRST